MKRYGPGQGLEEVIGCIQIFVKSYYVSLRPKNRKVKKKALNMGRESAAPPLDATGPGGF